MGADDLRPGGIHRGMSGGQATCRWDRPRGEDPLSALTERYAPK